MKYQLITLSLFSKPPPTHLNTSLDNVIIDGPSNLTVQPGEWGNFTCSVACTHFVDWYVEGFETGEISRTCSETLSDQTACMETVQPCASQTSTAEFVSRLRVLATNEFAGMNIAVQCSAIAHTFPSPSDPCPPPYLSFSRFSSLRGIVCLMYIFEDLSPMGLRKCNQWCIFY